MLSRLCVVLSVVGAVALAPGAEAQAPAAAQPRTAKIADTSGSVFVRRGSAQSETKAEPDQRLSLNDAIRTGAKSYAKLQVAPPSGLFELKAESQVSLQVLGDGGSDFVTRLQKGTIVVRESVAGDAKPRDCIRRAAGMTVQVPDGSVKGCGTEWSIEVGEEDPLTHTITVKVAVPDGSVEMANDVGKVMVPEGSVGQMRRGEMPTVLRLIEPRDRVQFVEFYKASAASYAAAGVEAGQTADAIERLEQSIRANGSADLCLAVVDLLLEAGDYSGARNQAKDGGAKYPRDARFDAMLARVELLEGNARASLEAANTAIGKDPNGVDGYIAIGNAAYRAGLAEIAQGGFLKATEIGPKDPRGYFGLGTVATEREDLVPARKYLDTALMFDAKGIKSDRASFPAQLP